MGFRVSIFRDIRPGLVYGSGYRVSKDDDFSMQEWFFGDQLEEFP